MIHIIFFSIVFSFDIDSNWCVLMTVRHIFEPKNIALIGASTDPIKLGNVILKNIIDAGYKGKIYPINPKADEVLGLKAYKSILDVPEDVDLAVFIIPSSKGIITFRPKSFFALPIDGTYRSGGRPLIASFAICIIELGEIMHPTSFANSYIVKLISEPTL